MMRQSEGEEVLSVDFGRGRWNRDEWINVKSSRWDYVKDFVQEADHITNPCPDLPDEETYANHVTDIYTSMVYGKKFEAKRKYDLEVTLENRRGQVQMDISCGGHHFGYQDETLPDSFYVGITACEGRNRFYDFRVRTGLPALDPAADGEH